MRHELVVLVRPFYRLEEGDEAVRWGDLKSVMSAASMPPFFEEDATGHQFSEGKGRAVTQL
jgi:hypothetical protein